MFFIHFNLVVYCIYNIHYIKLILVIGSIADVNSLNLSNNKLSGSIPSSFGALELSFLDILNNELSGPVRRKASSVTTVQSWTYEIWFL